jgi:UDP-N-acetylmuramyl pentapeptide phosphotransferase/UDP-N-acetylglucosamine-1-phosphate transferase
LCLVTATATLGFALWNWPLGKIFLGDGGAYLLGLWVVELGLLLPHRSFEISPMAPVLVGVYPLLETLFSMYRRKFVRSHPINHPDALHLHTLIYRRLILNPAVDITSTYKNKANAKVAIVVWGFVMVPVVCALVFYQHTNALLILIVFFALAYGYLYKRLIRFKAPQLLISSRRIQRW